MNRLISILIFLFLLFLVYIWISSVWDKDDHQKSLTSTSTATQESVDEDKKLKLSNYDSRNKDVHQSTDNQDDKKSPSDVVQVGGTDAPPAKTNGSVEKGSKSTKSTTTTTKPAGRKKSTPVTAQTQTKKVSIKIEDPARKHMVIAGNFVERINAESRMKDLVREGYSNIEIVNFDLSQYHTVCAGRYDDIMEARRIAKKLKDYLNIPAYVRVGKS